MFVLTSISDLIQIDPNDFTKPTAQAITDNINAKYANKVVQRVGLCICLFDIQKTSEGLIGHGTGIVNVHVDFRLLVFRPFKGEIVQGKILKADPQSITLGVEFFEDIYIPAPTNLFDGTTFNNDEKTWMWTTDEETELFFDIGEVVRFRVEAEEWHDQSPQAPNTDDSIPERKSPYRLIASMRQSGLGPTLWWDEQRAAEEDSNPSPR